MRTEVEDTFQKIDDRYKTAAEEKHFYFKEMAKRKLMQKFKIAPKGKVDTN